MLNTFVFASASNAGKVRRGTPNQDAVKIIKHGLFNRKPPLLIVADGLGGHSGGEIASKIVVETIKKSYLKNKSKASPREILEDAVHQAHETIRATGQKDQKLSTMGSTVVAALLENQHLHLINVGDSRLYLFRGKQIQQISFDQSVVAEKVRQGEISAEEAYTHPQKNQLTMSISARRDAVIPCYAEQLLEFDDVILLCSDGLWGAVPEKVIRAAACQLEPRLAANKLIDLANGFGGPDNVSVIIARYAGSALEMEDEADESS